MKEVLKSLFGGKKIMIFFTVLVLIFAVCVTINSPACNKQQNTNNNAINSINKDDIAIIYTNDTHGVSTNNIGFDGLASFKNKVKEKTENVLTVDAGDEVSGSSMVSLSHGMFAADMMNKIGYDFATIGNHEFDLTSQQLQDYFNTAKHQFLACNFNMQNVKPYAIKNIANKKIAFVGVGYTEQVADSPQLCTTIQKNVDAARAEGANIVILLTHLGEYKMIKSELASDKLAEHLTGVDVIFDGHTHSTIEDDVVNGIHITQAGGYLNRIGLLRISSDNSLNFNMIKDYADKDKDFTQYIAEKKQEVDPNYNEVKTKTDYEIPYYGEGNMQSSSREDSEGDLIADSYKEAVGAECGFVNATGYRAKIPKGDVTKENLCDLLPFAGKAVKIELTGQQIMDSLEHACRNTEKDYQDSDGRPVGSCADFLQVSGIQFKIMTDIPSSVVIENRNDFKGVEGKRRVTDIQINNEPIDAARVYTVGTSDYLAGGGCGLTLIKNAKVTGSVDDCRQLIADFITNNLDGKTSMYSKVQNRIVVENL